MKLLLLLLLLATVTAAAAKAALIVQYLQAAGIRTRDFGIAERCATNELHSPLKKKQIKLRKDKSKNTVSLNN